MFEKHGHIRSKTLLESTRDMECQIQIPGECDNGPCVPCHSNESALGKGGSIKADDIFVAAGCHTCHAVVDGRQGNMSAVDREWFLRRGILRTIQIWFKDGNVFIAGDKYINALEDMATIAANMDKKTVQIKRVLTRIAEYRPFRSK